MEHCNVETAFRLTTVLTGVLEICSLPSCRLVSAHGTFEHTGPSGGWVILSAGLKFSEISAFLGMSKGGILTELLDKCTQLISFCLS